MECVSKLGVMQGAVVHFCSTCLASLRCGESNSGYGDFCSEELDTARAELELAQRRGDLGRASELRYGRIPELEALIKKETEEEEKDKNVCIYTRILSCGSSLCVRAGF